MRFCGDLGTVYVYKQVLFPFRRKQGLDMFRDLQRLLRSAGVRGLGLGLSILPSFVTVVAPMRP